jgi:hypothetical protein
MENTMSRKLSVDETLELHGLEFEDLNGLVLEGIVPACCEDGCEVEPDGTCPHGNPSILLALGMI